MNQEQAAAQQPQNPVLLTAGPLTLRFEPRIGMIRYIRFGDAEVLRGITAPIRDHNWDTIEPILSDIKIEQSQRSFAVTFNARCKRDPVDYKWSGRIEGESSDARSATLSYKFDGCAESAFSRNRIGFCVLHPGTCAGQSVEVTHTDGSIEKGEFPVRISPHQPFLEVKAMSHAPAEGVRVMVELRGDRFETEDQRNWTDATFKTYCTPQTIPFPVEVAAGDCVEQEVVVRVEAERDESAYEGWDEPLTIRVDTDGESVALPAIGTVLRPEGEVPTIPQVALLRLAGLSHLRVELEGGASDISERLAAADRLAEALAAVLEVVLFVGDSYREELGSLAPLLNGLSSRVERLLVLKHGDCVTPGGVIDEAARVLGGGARLVVGTDAYFTELNRERPEAAGMARVDGLTYSFQPQVHAFDNDTMVENVRTQGETVRSAKVFGGGRSVHVGPVTLRGRGAESVGGLPVGVDARLASRFGACWLLGSLKQMAESGVGSVTYFETTGMGGILPDGERAWPDGVGVGGDALAHPVFHVLAALNVDGARVLPSESSDGLGAECLLLERRGGYRLIVCSMGDATRLVRVEGAAGEWRGRRLNGQSGSMALSSPAEFLMGVTFVVEAVGGVLEMELEPYELVVLDRASG